MHCLVWGILFWIFLPQSQWTFLPSMTSSSTTVSLYHCALFSYLYSSLYHGAAFNSCSCGGEAQQHLQRYDCHLPRAVHRWRSHTKCTYSSSIYTSPHPVAGFVDINNFFSLIMTTKPAKRLVAVFWKES